MLDKRTLGTIAENMICGSDQEAADFIANIEITGPIGPIPAMEHALLKEVISIARDHYKILLGTEESKCAIH